MKLAYGFDKDVANWVSQRIPYFQGADFGPSTAIGIVSEEGKTFGGVVYHDYHPEFRTIQVSIATVTPKWATRHIICSLLCYPFIQLGCNIVWSAIAHDNARAIRFNKGIGFVGEGVARFRFGTRHAYVSSMTRKEFEKRYLNRGKELPLRAASA